MKKCEDCKKLFPEHLVVFMRWDIGPLDIWPICARKIRNKLHRFPDYTPFPGEIAQAMYEEAIEFMFRAGSSSREGVV